MCRTDIKQVNNFSRHYSSRVPFDIHIAMLFETVAEHVKTLLYLVLAVSLPTLTLHTMLQVKYLRAKVSVKS